MSDIGNGRTGRADVVSVSEAQRETCRPRPLQPDAGRTAGVNANAVLAIVAVVLIAAFVVIERRHEDPLVPLRIFSNRSLSAADATLLLVVAALFGMFFFLTLYL